jgi:hypothetical protein
MIILHHSREYKNSIRHRVAEFAPAPTVEFAAQLFLRGKKAADPTPLAGGQRQSTKEQVTLP